MAEAVIVATSRTPIGRANKGSLVDARPDDLSSFILSDVMGKAGVEASDDQRRVSPPVQARNPTVRSEFL